MNPTEQNTYKQLNFQATGDSIKAFFERFDITPSGTPLWIGKGAIHDTHLTGTSTQSLLDQFAHNVGVGITAMPGDMREITHGGVNEYLLPVLDKAFYATKRR